MTPNIEARIYKALIDRLKTMSGGYEVVEPGQKYPTAANAAFINVVDFRRPVDRVYAASTADDLHMGILECAVMVPTAWTHMQLIGIGMLIKSHFPKDLRLDVLRIDKSAMIMSSYLDGAFVRLPVSISWRALG
jgi:hypothetical protein